MKKLYTILAAILLTATTFAQAPEKMSYQAVVRDGGDVLVTNQVVGMQISILQGSETGTSVYTETQTPTTNINGLVTLEIGKGTTIDIFSDIDWSTGTYFIKTETDPIGGSSYTITGTSQLLSVPFALYAKTSSDAGAVAANTAKVGYTEAAVSANTDVAANTAKVGYTEAAVSANTDVAANTAKVGYTEELVSANTDVAANTAKVGYTEAAVSANTDVAANTAKVGYTEAAVSANTDVAANTAKVGYTEELVSANTDVAANTAKVGYTEELVSANTDVAANTAKVGYTEAAVSANTDVAANTAKVGYTEPIYTLNTLYPELGGYVIAVRDGGKHGLVVAMQDQGISNWYEANDLLSNASNHDADGVKFMDWRLPTKRELNLMYVVYSNGNGASLNARSYWSSTEGDSGTAWEQSFYVGGQYNYLKLITDNVRAVRAF